MRKLLLAGVALGALTAGSAQAQVQSGPGFFGYLDGSLLLLPGSNSTIISNDFPGVSGKSNRGLGWGIEGKLGYSFGSLDVALAGGYRDYGKGDSCGPFCLRLTDGTLWNIDADLGYTMRGPGWGVRPFIGPRFFRFTTEGTDSGNGFSHRGRSWGIGPHIGVDGSVKLTGPISLFAGLDTSFLFGKIRDRTGPAFASARNDSRLFWQVGAKLGVDWEIAPLWHLAGGYKVSYWDGVQSEVAFSFAGGVTGGARGRAGLIEHGPFIRLAYNWGAPPPGPAAAPPMAPTSKSFIVFFDFDRANLTPTALNTIKQAAAQAKSGRATRIDVTGHADRSGSDGYNMALSLRRANAVKDQLVREGIAANQIVVVGRGESAPLVPTADGVREPQNRRVEIVLN